MSDEHAARGRLLLVLLLLEEIATHRPGKGKKRTTISCSEQVLYHKPTPHLTYNLKEFMASKYPLTKWTTFDINKIKWEQVLIG